MDKDKLLSRRLPEACVELDVGTVCVRGLSRAEALRLSTFKGDVDAAEVYLLHRCLVDPKLSEEEAAEYRELAGAEELDLILGKITEISGLRKAALGDAVKRFPDGSGTEVGVLPGAGTSDDGGAAPRGDE